MVKSGNSVAGWVLGSTPYAGGVTIPEGASRITGVKDWGFSTPTSMEDITSGDSLGFKEVFPTLTEVGLSMEIISDVYSNVAGSNGQKVMADALENNELINILIVSETTFENGVFSPKVGAIYRVVPLFVSDCEEKVTAGGVVTTSFKFQPSGRPLKGVVQ